MPKPTWTLSRREVLRLSWLFVLNVLMAAVVMVLGPFFPLLILSWPAIVVPIAAIIAFVSYRLGAWVGLALGIAFAWAVVVDELTGCGPDDFCADFFLGVMLVHPLGLLTTILTVAGLVSGAVRSWNRRSRTTVSTE